MPRLFKLGFDDRAGLLRYLQLRFVGSLMPKVKMKGVVFVGVYKVPRSRFIQRCLPTRFKWSSGDIGSSGSPDLMAQEYLTELFSALNPIELQQNRNVVFYGSG